MIDLAANQIMKSISFTAAEMRMMPNIRFIPNDCYNPLLSLDIHNQSLEHSYLTLIWHCIGWINQFLSWNGFVPLSRLTYCAYLIHIPILQMLSGGKRHGKYYNNVELVSVRFLYHIISYYSILYYSKFILLHILSFNNFGISI